MTKKKKKNLPPKYQVWIDAKKNLKILNQLNKLLKIKRKNKLNVKKEKS